MSDTSFTDFTWLRVKYQSEYEDSRDYLTQNKALSLSLSTRFQGLFYFIFLFMGVEEPILVTQYGLYLQPIMVISILLGIYSLTIVTKTLHPVAPGNDTKPIYHLLISKVSTISMKIPALNTCRYACKIRIYDTFTIISFLCALNWNYFHSILISEAKLQSKTLVLQLVLLFSKLQLAIIKSLPGTGLFPCNPPLTPTIYAYGKLIVTRCYFSLKCDVIRD